MNGRTDDTTRRRILRTLDGRNSLHVVELADVLEDHPITIDLACDRLQREGRIHQVGPGYYRLAEDGLRRESA